ncbi:MAG TPA: hypothetical protein DCX21_05615, partial [Eubacterium sp.]|nr:hypothetical protein [Eubacterium sp.]
MLLANMKGCKKTSTGTIRKISSSFCKFAASAGELSESTATACNQRIIKVSNACSHAITGFYIQVTAKQS